jgi:hypothetical protein
MIQEAKDYILNKYGEETLKGVENGIILINDKGLNDLMPKHKFTIELGPNTKDKWEDIIPKDCTLGEILELPKVDYYRWSFNHKVGDVVKFADGGFDVLNEQHCWKTLKPELATKTGIVIDCVCDLHAFLQGSIWSCKVDFDGEIVETLCGFFEKI